MKKKNEIKRELIKKEKERDALERDLAKAELSDKLSCVTDFVVKNKSLCEKINALPGDEVKIVMDEIINSPAFDALIDTVLCGSTRLAALRRSKAEKAARRKCKSEQSKPSDYVEGGAEII
ncbi:MAG: hypothetical protein MSH60_02420 [Ruminococcus sp.]|nr:hypothetical protein [Ruminococcus sp.]